MKNSTLLIDCQIFQTAAWDRGMGKYSLDLLTTLTYTTSSSYKEVILLFSDNLSRNQKMLDVVSSALPSSTIIWLDLEQCDKGPVGKTMDKNKKCLDRYIDRNNLSVDFLMLSAFQKPLCPAFPSNATKHLLFYDLIPLLYHQKYKPDDNYLSRLRTLFEAEKIYTISLTVKNDLNVHVGIPLNKMININGAPISRKHLAVKMPAASITTKFILMPTGDDVRKNNILGVKGFELFRKKHPDITLVLTSKFEPNFRTLLKKLSKNIIFTGNVTEEELGWLYQNAEMLLFPTEYEGLGLPVLEAMIENKKVVCSDIPVFQEMSESAFYYFNHHDAQSIESALTKAYADEDWKSKYEEYPKLLKRYSWENSAKDLLAGLNDHTVKLGTADLKKKIAVLGPIPSGYSAIGKVVAELHPTLSDAYDVDYYFEVDASGRALRPNYLHYVSNVLYAHEFSPKKYSKYDAVIYHIGNSEYHLETIKNALYLPGYIIIHDTFLDGVFGELQKHGYISAARRESESVLDKVLGSTKSKHLASIINAQIGAIVHSNYASASVSEVLIEDVTIKQANLPVSTPEYCVQNHTHDFVRIGLAGILTPRKGLDIIKQIASLKQFENCMIEIFGFNYGKNDLFDQISSLPNVTINTNLSDFEYQSKLAQLDILINYRHDYRGETSLTALEAMRYGVVAIVRDIGWFSELPNDSVVKVKNEKMLLVELERLVVDKKYRKKLGKAAQECTKQQYSPEGYVRSIQELIESKNNSKNVHIRNVLLHQKDTKSILLKVTELINRIK